MEKNRKAQKMKWTIVCYAQYGEKFQPYNLSLVLLLSKLFCFDFNLPFRDMSVRPLQTQRVLYLCLEMSSRSL